MSENADSNYVMVVKTFIIPIYILVNIIMPAFIRIRNMILVCYGLSIKLNKTRVRKPIYIASLISSLLLWRCGLFSSEQQDMRL